MMARSAVQPLLCALALAAAGAIPIAATGAVPIVAQEGLPDGLYAEVHTVKGTIVARLESEKTPLTVANFVGLAEGTIANMAFAAGRPYFDGTSFHRVVAGHVIQGGQPASERAGGPGYTFPNEIHADLSHDHAGALNMANGGPHTNTSQFCFMLGNRSYLDGDYTVFGDVVQGLDVVMRIVQDDVVDSVRIRRVGAAARAYRVDDAMFAALRDAAERRVAQDEVEKRAAIEAWIANSWPAASGPADSIRTARVIPGDGAVPSGVRQVRYTGTALRFQGHIIGYNGPPLLPVAFASGPDGTPGYHDEPASFTYQPGTTRINDAVQRALAEMRPGERRVIVVPAALAYGTDGYYGPNPPGQPRFVIPPNTPLVYDLEVVR
jgi:cyclophilin family peptidyl-prolyl cis-trans isomerase